MSAQFPPLNMPLRLNRRPSWMGMISSRQGPGHLSRSLKYQICFQDTAAYICPGQVEPLPAEREGPVDLMEKAGLSPVRLPYPESKLVRVLGGLERSSGAAN